MGADVRQTCFIPFLLMVGVSLTDMSLSGGIDSANYIGLDNYASAFNSDNFKKAIWISICYVVLSTFISVLIGVFIGLYIFDKVNLSSPITALLILPFLLSPVVVGLMWRLLLHGEFGPLGYLFNSSNLLNEGTLLTNTATALLTIIVIDCWQWVPVISLLIIVALVLFPEEPKEAALLDGLTKNQIRMKILFPALIPSVVVISAIRITETYREFDKIFVLTGGGPGTSTETLGVYLWRIIYKDWQIGYGAAVATLSYLFILGLTYFLFMASSRIANRYDL